MLSYLEFHKVWGGSIEDCSTKIRKFFNSQYVHELDVLPGAQTALKRLSEHFSLHVVTARQNHAEELTRAWITKHFPDIFTEIHFGNHYCPEGKSRTKAEICKSINAMMLVDDSISYARNCASEGIPVILFGNYPWNRPHEKDESLMTDEDWLVKEASHWDEVVDLIHQKLGVQARHISIEG